MNMLEQTAKPIYVTTNNNLAPWYKLAYRWCKGHLRGWIACQFGRHDFIIGEALIPLRNLNTTVTQSVIVCSHCNFMRKAKRSVVYRA